MLYSIRIWLLGTLLVSACALAQSTYSEILGTVTDPTGAAVEGARVRIKNLDTNVES